jgi:radical SAM superfamily enzyme YgiQ (UPF0313 family)
MARVFLLNPPSPELVRTPLLSFCHLAASLRAAGHEVALLDASAPFAPKDADEIARAIAPFEPDLVGIHLKTLHVQPAYAVAARLADRWPLVAGGPHATIRPDEPFAHGFAHVVRGEGEETLIELADALDGGRALGGVAGLSFRERGFVRHNPSRGFLLDLDALAPPMTALDLFDPAWYGAARTIPPAGILSSRGCPAACTFCANNVTGRRFRYRSAGAVALEIRDLRERYDLSGFSFLDDSFAVGSRRVRELCDALCDVAGPVWWTCTAHPAHLDRDTLAHMYRAGCRGVDVGMESADPDMLVRIGKGVTVERVLDVLGWAGELGIHTVVNLMFGWPDETDAELEATIAFLERAAPLAGGFNARGVVVPYPGTEIYDRHHERHRFTDWWIREAPLEYLPFPTAWSEAEILRAYGDDPALDRNYFGHPPHRVELIRQALRQKAERTLAATLRRAAEASLGQGVPAAGAR